MKNVDICPLCGNKVDSIEHITEQWLLAEIRKQHPDWVEENGICTKCIAYYRGLDKVLELED